MNKDKECRSFPEALKVKYGDSDDDDELDSILIPQNRREAYSRLHSCLGQQFLTLDAMMISHAGTPGDISSLCPNVVELDLTGNNFKSWTEVFRVLSQLPRLSFLNLSSNPLQPDFPKDEIDELVANSPIPEVKKLILNSTFTPMEIVFELLKLIQSQELHLSLNSYGQIVRSDSQFPTVDCLHIASNGIETSECLRNIGVMFPSLKSLIFCENPIQDISIDDMASVFPNLCTLSLSRTKINDWSHVDLLSKCPSLNDIRIDGVPLLNAYSAEEGRQFLISRLPNAQKLNRSTIDPVERENAERKFIRHYADKEERPSRYEELVSVHGQLQRLVDIDLGGRVKSKASVTIKFEERRLKVMTVKLRQNTADFKKELAKLVGLRPAEIRLFYTDIQIAEGFGAEEMRYPKRSLLDYHIEDGDEFEIVRRPPVRKTYRPIRK